jgi:SPP1 family predicted phage head-tail adaptor
MVAEVWVDLAIDTDRRSFGTERIRKDQLGSATTGSVTLRYRDDLGLAMRFCIAQRWFEILALADPDGRRRRIVCRVEEHAR